MILLPTLIKSVKKTARILEPNFGQRASGEVVSKGFGGDPTLLADKIAEGSLLYEFKDFKCEINSEERGVINLGEPEIRLIIDPLDGSTNFSRGIYPWAISVYAETMKGEPLAGVVYEPLTKSLFYAEKNRGAFLNDKPISPVDRPLKNSIASIFMHPKNNFSIISQGMQILRPHVDKFSSHCCTSVEVCWIACGKLDLLVHLTPDARAHDYLAALLILEEAGGVYSNLNGDPFTRHNSSLIAAASRKNHQQIIDILKVLNNS